MRFFENKKTGLSGADALYLLGRVAGLAAAAAMLEKSGGDPKTTERLKGDIVEYRFKLGLPPVPRFLRLQDWAFHGIHPRHDYDAFYKKYQKRWEEEGK